MYSHGRKLTQKEYEYYITTLFEEFNNRGKTNSEELHRKELELTIDYRLGVDFPEARREALWLVHQKVEKKGKKLLYYNILVRLLPRLIGNYQASRLIRYMLKEYAQVLSADEMNDLFMDN